MKKTNMLTKKKINKAGKTNEDMRKENKWKLNE